MSALLPTRTNGTGYIKTFRAAARIAFGAAVVYTAEGTVSPATASNSNVVLGIAMDDEVEHLYEGFYEIYESVPVMVSGACRALVAFNADADLIAGDYLDVGDYSSAGTENQGVLDESGGSAGSVRVVTTTVARSLENEDMGALFYPNVADTAAGSATLALFVAGTMATSGITEGDYILIADINGAVQLNRVKSISGLVMTLVIPLAMAVDQSDGDLCYHVFQKEVLLV
jgi:hypothetical protein